MAKSFPNTGVTVIDTIADLPASPSEGMVVFQKDTNELKIYDGSVWVSMLDTDTPPALTKVTSGTFSGATTFNITNVFSSSFNHYRLILNNASSSASFDLYARLLVDTTPFTTSAYYWAWRGLVSNGTSGDSAAAATAGYMGLSNTVGNAFGNGSYDILNPFLTNVTSVLGIATGLTSGVGYSVRSGGFSVDTLTSYNGIQLLSNSTPTISGDYTIYGYRI